MLTSVPTFLPPLPAAVAILPAPERMAVVMRRTGEGTTLRDFRRAAETCDLTEAELEANIGAAARLLDAEIVRYDQPAAPVMPWNHDPEYRKERVRAAAAHLAGMLPSETEMFAHLRQCNFDAREIGDLWSEIQGEVASLFGRARSPIMARIIVDLTVALNHYDRPDNTVEAAELVKSMRVVLEALRDQHELPRGHVLTTIRAFVAEIEQSDLDLVAIEATRKACATLSDLWRA